MELYQDIRPGRQVIQAYGDGGFRIAGVRRQGSVLILPDASHAWPVADLAALSLDSLDPVLSADPPVELLLLGSGADFQLAPAELRTALRGRGIGLEAMATPAACRTFNLLLADDRRVAAALIAV